MINENRPTNASLSTMWAIKNYPDLNDFFQVSRNMGFQKIELNHQVDSEMLSCVTLDHYQFSSVHEPCPADILTRDMVDRDWLISSQIEICRMHGVQAVKQSINLACKLGAQVVVIHCGNVTPDMSLEIKLRSLFKARQTQSDEYLAIKSQIIQSRMDQVGPRLQAVKKSLSELIDYAIKCDVKLGLENRYHYMDIPIIDEMEELLQLTDSNRLGFIYDVGHAQALGRLGFFPPEDWLYRYSRRILGSHLHDVVGLSDHLAPGIGEINFKDLSTRLPGGSFRTVEIQPGNTIAQLKDSIDYLVQVGCIKYI
jgi:sugar phosphate isomerase/epimerase